MPYDISNEEDKAIARGVFNYRANVNLMPMPEFPTLFNTSYWGDYSTQLELNDQLLNTYTAKMAIWREDRSKKQNAQKILDQMEHDNYKEAFAILEYEDAERAKEEAIIAARERPKKIVKATEVVVADCLAYAKTTKNFSSAVFFAELAKYLGKRKSGTFFSFAEEDNSQLETRTNFIRNFLSQAKAENIRGQLDLLQEDNIKNFKGWVTKTLYNLLVGYRGKIQIVEPRQEIGFKRIEPLEVSAEASTPVTEQAASDSLVLKAKCS